MEKQTDCALFIDETMAKFIVAWRRSETKRMTQIAKVLGITQTRAGEIKKLAISSGVLDKSGVVTPLANGLVDTLIKRKIESLKG
jgi:hypothetical protein